MTSHDMTLHSFVLCEVRLSLLEHDAGRAFDARGVARASLDDVQMDFEADRVLWGEVIRATEQR